MSTTSYYGKIWILRPADQCCWVSLCENQSQRDCCTKKPPTGQKLVTSWLLQKTPTCLQTFANYCVTLAFFTWPSLVSHHFETWSWNNSWILTELWTSAPTPTASAPKSHSLNRKFSCLQLSVESKWTAALVHMLKQRTVRRSFDADRDAGLVRTWDVCR